MKKGKVFFHPIDGSGALTISWSSGPKGDAIEARKGSGVGFFSPNGDLLCVIFDEVEEHRDHQVLEFANDCIEIHVDKGKVEFNITQRKAIPQVRKSRGNVPTRRRKVAKPQRKN
ncbi:MAG: hypothetical protein JSS30_03565 [Verrucomicrobia bacterium]|nr:hypothetical protein [Verrucomicrobiota bacterium]